jgi:hypothetical protein
VNAVDAYVRRETLVSILINGVLSLVFFLIVFGTATTVPSRGLHGLAVDFIPQSFMIALMSTLVPGALTLRRVRVGTLPRSSLPTRLPARLVPRALLVAVLAVLIGAGIAGAVVWFTAPDTIGWLPALLIKLAYGGLLAAVTTPPGLRAALRGDAVT